MFVHYDADSLIYKAAFVAQKTLYKVDDKTFESMQECVEQGFKDPITEVILIDNAEAVALSVVNNAIGTLIQDVVSAFPTVNPILILYMTGSINFRREICKTYKANRTAPKPLLYDMVKRYILNKYTPYIIEPFEADDTASSAHCYCQSKGHLSLLVHIDKDLNSVVGVHYNPDKRQFYNITVNEAITNHYRQLLSGDTVDNIKGIKGYGAAKAAKALPLPDPEEGTAEVVNRFEGIVKDIYQEKSTLENLTLTKKLVGVLTDIPLTHIVTELANI